MTNIVHIHLYYNLEISKDIITENNITENKFYITEKSIITDKKIVSEILKHEKTKINEYGELIDYDFDYLIKNINNDISNYKDKHKSSFEYSYNIISFYYVKCELVTDIRNQIENFLYFN